MALAPNGVYLENDCIYTIVFFKNSFIFINYKQTAKISFLNRSKIIQAFQFLISLDDIRYFRGIHFPF